MPKAMDYTQSTEEDYTRPTPDKKMTYMPDDAYVTPKGRQPMRTTPNAPQRGRGGLSSPVDTFTSKRHLFAMRNGSHSSHGSPDLYDKQRVDPSFATAAGLARRQGRMSFTTNAAELEQRNKAMQFLATHQSTKAARRNVEDNGRVAMSVNEESIVRLAHHGGALHLTYSGLVGHGKHAQHQRLQTILSVSLPVVEPAEIAARVQQIYQMMTKAVVPLTDHNVEDFGGHTIHMALDNDLHEALEPGVSTALGAVSNAAATSMATRMNRAVRA